MTAPPASLASTLREALVVGSLTARAAGALPPNGGSAILRVSDRNITLPPSSYHCRVDLMASDGSLLTDAVTAGGAAFYLQVATGRGDVKCPPQSARDQRYVRL